MFNWFRKQYFEKPQQLEIVAAIRAAEKNTSGEIRLFVEGKNKRKSGVLRASEIFQKLKMHNTERRNAVLVYVAMTSKQVAIFADEGIFKKVDQAFWDSKVSEMISTIKSTDVKTSLIQIVGHIGDLLSKEFPYIDSIDRNELPDDIVFGK